MDIIRLFCEIDDFCKVFEPQRQRRLLAAGLRQRRRATTPALSEVMTMAIAFHQSGYRTFKDFYTRYVTLHWRWAFPCLVSYNRFVELRQATLVPLCASLQTRKGHSQGIAFLRCHPVSGLSSPAVDWA